MQLYKISFTTTPKVYIGITNDINRRFRAHKKKTSNSYISRAIRKHGNPILTVIAECEDRELLFLAEQEAIEKFNSKRPNGYNLTDGGDGAPGTNINKKCKVCGTLIIKIRCRKCEYERQKKWALENPEKIKANKDKYKPKKSILEKEKRLLNLEEIRKKDRDNYQLNKDKKRKSQKKSYLKNKEKIKERKKLKEINNKEIINVYC